MNIFITATDTDAGKTYVARGIVTELLKRGKKTGYFKPLQSGIIENVLSDADNVKEGASSIPANHSALLSNNSFLTLKNSYITNTPCTPSISAKIDGIEISLNKIENDYKELEKKCDIVVTEGSGGLFVPVNDNSLVSDIIKKLNLSVIVVARPNLGTINHTLLTLSALQSLDVKILGVVISNYPENTNDPAITTAPELIEKFGKVKILDIIKQNQNNFKKIADEICP